MISEVKTENGCIDFILPTPGSVKEVHDNTYLHCNFVELWIGGFYTPIKYRNGTEGV